MTPLLPCSVCQEFDVTVPCLCSGDIYPDLTAPSDLSYVFVFFISVAFFFFQTSKTCFDQLIKKNENPRGFPASVCVCFEGLFVTVAFLSSRKSEKRRRGTHHTERHSLRCHTRRKNSISLTQRLRRSAQRTVA